MNGSKVYPAPCHVVRPFQKTPASGRRHYWTKPLVRNRLFCRLVSRRPIWQHWEDSAALKGDAHEPKNSARQRDQQSLKRPLPHGGGKMTTEIAVSNQLGIALATDSAVTITSAGHRKVFNTADKLFELSATCPVAVMINGNMDCLGTPWEILIKSFRAIEGSKPRGSIERWARDLLAYVEGHNPNAEDATGGYIDRAIRNEIKSVQDLVLVVVQAYVFQASRGSDHILTKGDLDIRKVLAAAIELRNKHLSEFPIAPSLTEVSRDGLREKYTERIHVYLEKAFKGQKLADDEISALTSLVIESLLRASESASATGIVVLSLIHISEPTRPY